MHPSQSLGSVLCPRRSINPCLDVKILAVTPKLSLARKPHLEDYKLTSKRKLNLHILPSPKPHLLGPDSDLVV